MSLRRGTSGGGEGVPPARWGRRGSPAEAPPPPGPERTAPRAEAGSQGRKGTSPTGWDGEGEPGWMRGGGPERAAAGPAGSLRPCGSLLQDCLLSRGRTPIHPSKPSPKSTSSEEPSRLSLALRTPFSPSAHNTSTPRPR
eukprot:XP_022279182.1 proline-rich protein 36-like [Canis lupus familiaris]